MAHPIHQASENSPFGDLTKEEFYKTHHVIHQEEFILNKGNMKIFTQSWYPDATNMAQLKGLVAMVHGYISESSWIFQLTATAIAKLGFFVCALDLQGHGYSDGSYGHIPDIHPVVDDCIQFFNTCRADHPKLPAFLYGESLGGAIAILISLKQKGLWNGLLLNGAMCGVSPRYKPAWPLEKLLPMAAYFAPKWRIAITKPLASKSYKEEWKRRLVVKSPNCRSSGKPSAATALEFLRVCEKIKKRFHKLELPLLVVHGEDDLVCDSDSARLVYELAGSKDKTLKIFPGMWHQLIGETKENVELVFQTIFSWLRDQADIAVLPPMNNLLSPNV
ncbi:caffeoylshikimate esterase-like [Macadamia integrifolia]|uniref:caffeoylshikimate esterase-like n=1 Tax=Macadamia integrifolia TaxID=60698 RepID=UPI001C4E48D2|nr:caffeoylshikimate esterase-like [Macadamia integrifolia]